MVDVSVGKAELNTVAKLSQLLMLGLALATLAVVMGVSYAVVQRMALPLRRLTLTVSPAAKISGPGVRRASPVVFVAMYGASWLMTKVLFSSICASTPAASLVLVMPNSAALSASWARLGPASSAAARGERVVLCDEGDVADHPALAGDRLERQQSDSRQRLARDRQGPGLPRHERPRPGLRLDEPPAGHPVRCARRPHLRGDPGAPGRRVAARVVVPRGDSAAG